MNLWQRLKFKLGRAELDLKHFTQDTHTAYYEYFLDGKNYFIRIYDRATHAVIKELRGVAQDARRAAQKRILAEMDKLKIAKS